MSRLFQKLRQDDAISPVQRLLVLLAVDVGAAVVTGAAAGIFHFKLFNALVAALAAVSAVVSFPSARAWFLAPEQPAQQSSPSLRRAKKVLVLVMAAGAIAYVGGRGTFAIFTAETANSPNAITSGTLVLGDANATTGTTCYSYGGTTVYNSNYGCGAVWTGLGNVDPGTVAQTKLTIDDEGSIDASKFYLFAPNPRTTLAATLSPFSSPSSSSVVVNTASSTGFLQSLAVGNTLAVSEGSNSESVVVSAIGSTAGTTTTITVQLPSGTTSLVHTYDPGARVENTSANKTAANTECFDQTTTSSNVPVTGATPGSTLPFVTTTNNPLCSSLVVWVQEQEAVGSTTINYCWYGFGSSTSLTPATNGQCRTPTTTATNQAVAAGTPISTLTVSALTGNIAKGDVLQITGGGKTEKLEAAADAYINDTTISVANVPSSGGPTPPWTPTNSYSSGAALADLSAQSDVDNDSYDTVSNFDTLHPKTAPIQLEPLTQDGSNSRLGDPSTTATVWLAKHGSAGSTRVFYIGVDMPLASGQSQNQLQGLLSTFGLSWHIEQ